MQARTDCLDFWVGSKRLCQAYSLTVHNKGKRWQEKYFWKGIMELWELWEQNGAKLYREEKTFRGE